MGNSESSARVPYQRQKSKLDNSREFCKVKDKYFSYLRMNYCELYSTLKDNKKNFAIASGKKKFDSTFISSKSRKNTFTSWKKYIFNYFIKKAKEGVNFYNTLIIQVENEPFLMENAFQSEFFFSDFFQTQSTFKQYFIEEARNVENSIFSTSKEKEIVNIMEKNFENNSKIFQNPMESGSRINLENVTENLGGSFMYNSFSIENLQISTTMSRYRIKYLLHKLKNHLLDKEHPITIIIQMFEAAISKIIRKKTEEFRGMEDDAELKEKLDSIHSEIVEHINKFTTRIQVCLKLFYSEAIDLECFNDEKDELVNLVSTILFSIGTLHEDLLALYSLKMEEEVESFRKILVEYNAFNQKDLEIQDKFALSEETEQLINELKKSKIEVSTDAPLTTFCTDRKNISIATSNQVRVEKEFYEKNSFHEFDTAIKILKGIKSNSVPFEKMMLIASVGTEITNCINEYWKGMEHFIKPTYLHIDADQLMNLFIYILIKAQFPEILVHLQIISDFTTKSIKNTVLGYYSTTVQAAVNFIQSSVELRDKIVEKKSI